VQNGVLEYRFGPYRLKPGTSSSSKRPWRLYKNDKEVELTARTHQLLIFLVAHRGERIPTAGIIAHVWQGKALGDEKNSLDELVNRLRTLLDDDGRYIDRGEGEIEFVHPVEVRTAETRGTGEVGSENGGPGTGAGESETEGEAPPETPPKVDQGAEPQPPVEETSAAPAPKQPQSRPPIWLVCVIAALFLSAAWGAAYYRKMWPAAAPKPNSATKRIGISLWRLQETGVRSGDKQRIIEHPPVADPKGEAGAWVPELAHSGFVVSPGERIRLTLTSDVRGFVYVIDREQYSDGRSSDGVLIFPTERIQYGSNEITFGVGINIPSAKDLPAFLEVKKSGKTHIGEELTILFFSRPRTDLRVAAEPLQITTKTFEELKFNSLSAVLLNEEEERRKVTPRSDEGGVSESNQLVQAQKASQLLYKVPEGWETSSLAVVLNLTFRSSQ
jgi:hypothetical protein